MRLCHRAQVGWVSWRALFQPRLLVAVQITQALSLLREGRCLRALHRKAQMRPLAKQLRGGLLWLLEIIMALHLVPRPALGDLVWRV